MSKCPSPDCGWSGDGKFCKECGLKMEMEHVNTPVVICDGKLEDGSPCGTEIVKTMKFCVNCGSKIDPNLFAVVENNCKTCGTKLSNMDKFCPECGEKVFKETSNISGKAVQKTVTPSVKLDVEMHTAVTAVTTTPTTVTASVTTATTEVTTTTAAVTRANAAVTTATVAVTTATADVTTVTAVVTTAATEVTTTTATGTSVATTPSTVTTESDLHATGDSRGVLASQQNEVSSKNLTNTTNISETTVVNSTEADGTENNRSNNNSNDLDTNNADMQTLFSVGSVQQRLRSENNNETSPDGNVNPPVNDTGAASKEKEETKPTIPAPNNTKSETETPSPTRSTKGQQDPSKAEVEKEEEDLKTSVQNINLKENSPEKMETTGATGGSEVSDITANNENVKGEDNHDEGESEEDTDDENEDVDMNDDNNSGTIDTDDTMSVGSVPDKQESATSAKGQKRKGTSSKKAQSQKKRERKQRSHDEKFHLSNEKEQIGEKETRKTSDSKEKKKETKIEENKFTDTYSGPEHSENLSQTSNQGIFRNSVTSEKTYSSLFHREETVFGNRNNISPSVSSNVDTGASEIPPSSLFSTTVTASINQPGQDGATPGQTGPTAGLAEQNLGTDKKKTAEKTAEKTAKEKENTSVKNQSGKGGKNKNEQSDVRPGKVMVIFHVLVSVDFLDDPDNAVLVLFGRQELGSWNDQSNKLYPVRQYKKYVEYEYKMEMYRYLLVLETNCPYKYCVRKRSKKDQIKFAWENYYSYHDRHLDFQNRKLDVAGHLLGNKVEWHQYDGLITPVPNSGVLKVVTSGINFFTGRYEKDCEKHAIEFAQIFCPPLFKPEFDEKSIANIQNSMELLDSLVNGLRKVYYVDARCWKNEADYKAKVCGSLMSPLIEAIGKKEPSEHESYFKIVRALSVVVAVNRIQLVLPLSDLRVLCNCLLLTPDPEKKGCVELERIDAHFKRDVLKKSLLGLVKNVCDYGKDPSWLLCLPLIHVVFGMCQPFEEITKELSHANKEPKWWGITGIEKVVGTFKDQKDKWLTPMAEVLAKLHPLFEMDMYLPRSIVACLQPHELAEVMKDKHIPVEVCCASTLHWLKTTAPTRYSTFFSSPTGEEKSANECVAVLLLRLQQYFCDENESEIRWFMAYRIAASMVVEAVLSDRESKVMYSTQVFLHCVSVYEKIVQKTDKQTEDKAVTRQQTAHLDLVPAAFQKIYAWLNRYKSQSWYTYMKEYLKVWNMAFVEQLQSEEVLNLWNEKVSTGFLQTLQREVSAFRPLTRDFVGHYCRTVQDYCKPMQDCLTKMAFKAIEHGYDYNYFGLDDSEKKRFGGLLSDLFEKQWDATTSGNKDKVEYRIFYMMLTWSPIKQFIKNRYEDAKNQILSSKCKENLDVAVTIVDSHRASILDGAVEVGTLKDIYENVTVFCEVVQLINPKDRNIKQQTMAIIQMRMKEKEAFEKQVQQMTLFVNQCQHLPSVNTADIDRMLRMAGNIDSHIVGDFCKPTKASPDLDVNNTRPNITAFEKMGNVLEIVPMLEKRQSSFVFDKMWRGQCNGEGTNCTSPDDVVTMIWLPVEKKWQDFSQNLRSGDITFNEVEHMIGNTFRDDEQRLRQEMEALGIPDNTVKKRTKQLKQNRELASCVKGAQVILQFKNQYKLKGNFDPVRNIASHTEKNFRMNEFDESLMKTCEFLKEVTPTKSGCLEVFVRCDELVEWLKDSMKTSGQKELKVFVDLAMMSAGEEPLNIAKVQCLHSAVIGYAPLIFELKPECDYKQLLNMCEVVWRELGANPNLPKQLWDTNRQLKWLQEIKKAHGSVEVTSLMQAEGINADGVYSVGRHAWKTEILPDLHNMSVKDTVRLTVPKQEGQRQLRNYTFSQLQDLQSRLMLVAGKAESGNVNVERFTMIFDSIIRLSSVYTKLCSSGCVLFNDWTATFFCSPDEGRPVCAVLEFGQGDVPKLKGRRLPEEQLEQMIPAIAKFMETCLEEWLSHIREKRKTYFHLNYFTIDQLVILQRELVKMGTEEEPSDLIYPLLSAVKENCTPDDVKASMAAAKQQVDGIVAEEEEMQAEMQAETEEINLEQVKSEKRREFIQELVESGYSVELATQACDHVSEEDIKIGDVSEAIVWCMDHGTDMEEDKEADQNDLIEETVEIGGASGRETAGASFSGWSNTDVSIGSLIKENLANVAKGGKFGLEPLKTDLQVLWRTFLDSISSNISDYLSLEHLGLILRQLSSRDERSLQRDMPPGFVEGEPNLVICPSGDILNTTLSVYMYDEDQPLPQSDEVLMCTANTTKDEVDIFWRRAIFDTGKKIHCLVHADMLGFDVSEAAEQCLEDYLQDTHHDKDKSYRLLVICGSDNEYRSTIVSSLDKYIRQTLPLHPEKQLEYVTGKFQQPRQTAHGIKPAACVDTGRLSARLIKSSRAGVGKTLYMKRREADLSILNGRNNTVKVDRVTIPLQEKHINMNYVTQRLLQHIMSPNVITTKIFHIDISHEVQEGIDYFLFNLLILNCLVDKSGYVWRRCSTDLYLIETMPIMTETTKRNVQELHCVHPVFNILPDVICRSPQESLRIYSGQRPPDFKPSDQLFDQQQFTSAMFQRPFQYLLRLDQNRNLNDVLPHNPEETPQVCLQVFLRHCGVQDPSWSELHHFVWFLNTQLVDFERNQFVSIAANEDLPGFAKFVLRFLMQMSRDFSTRSLNMSEESPGLRAHGAMEVEEEQGEEGVLEQYQMRRTWESSPHPYLFFNSDRFTFTFLGFYIERATGNLVDLQTRRVLENAIMAQNLYDALVRNHVPIQEDFDSLPRDQKIMKLCFVMGIDMPHDPDDTYELTTDNVKKIMAIYMRFRCDIPVIIMGETGCGKTRLIKFMCALQAPPGVEVKNMILMKVHGGTTNNDIQKKVRDAEKIAKQNTETFGPHMYTVLFFDEANTTESIGLIKEIMCDKSIEGRKLEVCDSLKMVAACNPYRKHSDELIKKLEQAGLGYHVDADETTDRLGRVPMRRLVYRVQPLPQSLLPLVWDFGQLNTDVEDLYIRQMVRRYIREDKLPDIPRLIEVVSRVLTASQDYMRNQRDECSFVSLRDVDRVLTVMSWFYEQSEGERTLFGAMDERLYDRNAGNVAQQWQGDDDDVDLEDDDENEVEIPAQHENRVDEITRSLILALGVCYHACLKTRDQYRQHIARCFQAPCQLHRGADQILEEIECCQDVFLDNVTLDKNIAKNMALKENVFMMVVCIELRIPLFLVGKPGSSKSLAKTIVSDAMQGNSAKHDLFKGLKQAQMVSFQCSPLSTPDGIVGTFRQCAQFQKDKDLESFVSIVVLDEVGLAEDSPRMPLKTLHPLLEDGCQGDETPEKHMKVAFIGISNWALDPAKMNRGILVQREVPDIVELQNSAKGICQTSEELDNYITPFIEPLSESYLEIFGLASTQMREFFGLRDFYSLVKMVYGFVEKSKQKPTWFEMLHAIKRNFGGLDQLNPVNCFKKHLATVLRPTLHRKVSDPDCTASGLIQACLFDTNKMKSESRYLLLLTENYGALSIIQQQILAKGSDIRPITIFGSSFRSDQEYTQVCRNINKIKVCMETGNTVVLLNLENLYESLYDALNQYYVYFGGERYVDLGLGTHRVKCPVHKNFRLIVVAEKQTVYKKFPIPLINRLEKHFLNINTMLDERQQELVNTLEHWVQDFAHQNNQPMNRHGDGAGTTVGDVFIGYHEDTCSAVVLHVSQSDKTLTEEEVLRRSKMALLWCATPESVVKLGKTNLYPHEQRDLKRWYLEGQAHDNFMGYLQLKLLKEECQQLFAQITTHSKLLAGIHKFEISQATGIAVERILLLETLSSFDTEQQFSNRIQQHLQVVDKDPSMMVIQCDSGDVNANLIACARYCVMDEYEKLRDQLRAPVHVVFIVQLPRKKGGCFTGFQCGIWHSAHIDDLYPEDDTLPRPEHMFGKTVGNIFQEATPQPKPTIGSEMDHRGDTGEQMEWTENDVELPPRLDSQGEPMEAETTTAGEPVNMSGITVGFVEPGYRGDEQYKTVVKVEGIVKKCIQSALSMVKDKSENSGRETERVKIVLRCLHEPTNSGHNAKRFVEGLTLLIGKLLGEKDDTHGDFRAKFWLETEAAAQESINKAGTFRRSCLQTLVAKVSPVLAGIIGYLDTNENLDILNDGRSPWKQSFWLMFLNTKNAVQLQFTDLQSPKRRSDLGEVMVMTTGYEGHTFKGQMPFSWVIFDMISDILKEALPGTGEDEEHIEAARKVDGYARVVMDSSLGHILDQLVRENCGDMEQQTTFLEELMRDYVHDFVHMKYYPRADGELQLVCQSLMFKTMQLCQESRSHGNLVMSMLCVHFAYDTLALRLSYFRSMNSVWPQCSAAIMEVRERTPDHFMFAEQEFTFSALCFLIENLTPKPKELDEPRNRTAWLNRVHSYRPVIEKVIGLHREDPNLYGVHSEQSIRRAKTTWSRVMIVKLFIEDVCVTTGEDKFTIKYCMPLWKILGDEVNLKEVKSINGIEKFLKTCNGNAVKEYLGSEVICSICEATLQGPPISLPCPDKHKLCDRCAQEMKALDEQECPICKTQLQPNWQPVRTQEKREQMEKLAQYQKRCNTFFMDMVSQLCFADKTPPSQPVIEKLLDYITCSSTKKVTMKFTKEMTIFDTGIDPNPVFRSYLLQLLMKTSEDSVRENLQTYLRQAETFMGQERNNDLIDLSLLVMQCLEDTFLQKTSGNHQATCKQATLSLQHAQSWIDTEALTIEKLYGIAHARMGLSTTAMYIAHIVKNNIDNHAVDRDVRKLLEQAQILCEKTKSKWPKTYLVKHLCRCYGIEIYQTVCRSQVQFLRWVAIKELNRDQNMEVSDRYIVCGESYTKVRESLTKVILGEDVSHLEEQIEELHATGARVEVLLHLAIHRELTCSNLRPKAQRQHTPQTIEKVVQVLQTSDAVQNKELGMLLIQNSLPARHLVTVNGTDLRHQGVQCLLVHYIVVMSRLNGDRTLLHPLKLLMTTPQAAANMFLPTMPQDDLDEVREALLAGRGQNLGENPVFYRCPNGHPYIIGNCGRPATVGNCRDCGQPIGGEGYQLRPGNQLDQGGDATQTGHILGRVARRGPPRPERDLTPGFCSVLRLLLHMSMYVGTTVNPQTVSALIKPDIIANEAADFLWEHICRDIDDLQHVLTRSADDVLLIMHTIVNTVLTRHNEEMVVKGETCGLQSKRGRKDWENQFSQQYIQTFFQELDGQLKTYNQLLAQDQRLGANPLLCVLYETDNQAELEDSHALQEIPRVWRFRTPISVEHMRQEFEAKDGAGKGQKQLGVLRLFLKEDHVLQALQYIPSILSLQRILIQKYQRKLDKAEGNTITLKHVIQDKVAGPETEHMINDFKHAWDLVREALTLYMCPTELGGMMIPKEFSSRTICVDTPLSVLLPTNKEAGLCSYAILDLLFRKQNDFLDKYQKETRRKPESQASVPPAAVTAAHLISYNHDHDILPLILANCQYTFEMGKGTKIEYDFVGIERQLMDRFLFSKSRIDVGRVLEVEQMVYRTEFTNAAVFKKLSDKILQESLNAAVKTQICDELRSLPDVCRSLDNLDIAISFLKTTGGQQTTNLYDFMAKTLQMEQSMTSQKARQICEFQHAKSLWLLMSLQKSKLLIDHFNQNSHEVFESLLIQFHEDLPEEVTTLFNDYMKTLTIDKLSQLLEALHEFLLLQVAIRENRDDEDFVDTTNNKLGEYLFAYVESLDNPGGLDLAILGEFPKDILYKHGVNSWITAYKTMKKRQGGQRRH